MTVPTRTSVRRRKVDTYASLRIPTYRILFVIGAFGFVATQSQAIARGLLANELSDSNTGLGGVFMAFGVPMLLITEGAQGARLWAGADAVRQDAFAVEPVDTTGAGDTFLGYFIAGLDSAVLRASVRSLY